MTHPLLELRDITKAFGDNLANDHINLRVYPGRVHALVGENGAGKTTMMTMIAGTATPDAGQILWDGEPVSIASPHRAAELGIGMVHQHFKLVPSLTVAANVFLGREKGNALGALDTAAMEREVAALSDKFGLDVDPTARVHELSVGQRQRVEVLKALSHDTKLLILDEPTAVLTPSETDELFVVIRSLAQAGCAVLFISHKLDEVLAISDEISVIRDGHIVGTQPAAGLTRADIARMMVGRDVLLRVEHTPAHPGADVLVASDLRILDGRGLPAVRGIDLTVRAGEIVGIAGVDGNGQSELVSAIAGMTPLVSGHVAIDGRDLTKASVRARRQAGLAYIPEDRHQVGTAPSMSVAENIAATHLAPPVSRAGWLSLSAVADQGRRLIKKFDIRGARATTPAGDLSGGNMQKVVISREFESDPKLLIVSQPTRGVDVGAMEFVHRSLVAARDKGAGILLVSADLNEVMSLSDRLLVIHRGQIVAEFTQDTMNETAVGLAMAGVEPEAERVAEAESKREAVAQAVSTNDPVPAASAGTETRAQLAPAPAAESRVTGGATAVQREAEAAAEPSGATAAEGKHEAAPAGRGWMARIFSSWLQPLIAIAIALLIGMVIIACIGRDPFAAYYDLLISSFTTPAGIGAVLAQAVPLLVLAAGVIVSYRAGFFNIGGEGQLYVGALAGAVVGFALHGVPGPLHSVLILLAAFVAGAVWGFIPGALLALWRVDIIVTTLMMSSIGTLLTAYLVTGPFKDRSAGFPATPLVNPDAMLPMFAPEYGFGLDFILALLVVVLIGLLLERTVWGLHVRELGEMNRFAEYTGVSPKSMSMQVMALSGGVSGLAGALFVLGPNGGRFLQSFSPGYAFLAITVALLARLNPWASIIAALFYANMMAGGNQMQIDTQVPFPMVNIIQGLIILLITGTVAWRWRRRRSAGPVPDQSLTERTASETTTQYSSQGAVADTATPVADRSAK